MLSGAKQSVRDITTLSAFSSYLIKQSLTRGQFTANNRDVEQK